MHQLRARFEKCGALRKKDYGVSESVPLRLRRSLGRWFFVNNKSVDLDVVLSCLSSCVVSNWKKLETLMVALRKEKSDETFEEQLQQPCGRTIACVKRN